MGNALTLSSPGPRERAGAGGVGIFLGTAFERLPRVLFRSCPKDILW